MTVSAAARRNYGAVWALTTLVAAAWSGLLITGYGGPTFSQAVSNVGLTAVTLAAAAACAFAARRNRRRRLTWIFLAASTFSWGAGMVIWTWYESILGREVPFPSLADVGYLGAVPFAAAALITLAPASQSLAGRARTVLDGMIIAGALLVTSWAIVLEPLFEAGGDLLPQVIGLAYPIGDVIVVTMVLYVLLRVRQTALKSAFPLGLIGVGLLAFAVADSGFVYLTATGQYSSGALIDVGWFLGYALIFVAAFKPTPEADEEEGEATEGRSFALLLPYAAVGMALATTSIDLLRTGSASPMVSWLRTFIIGAMVVRQILTLLENISLTRHLEARVVEVRASEQRFKGLVQHSTDVVTLIDPDGTVRYQSDSVERVFGYLADAMIGRPVADLLDPRSAKLLTDTLAELADEPYGIRVLELQVRHRSGRACHAEMTVSNLLENPAVRGLVLNTRDISERKTLEDQLVHSAFHDSLTTLANRALFRERVDETLSNDGARPGGKVAVLFLDLDGFKQVNDLLGHASGDLLLVQVAERLRSAVRPTDTVARLGGDEFAVLLEDAEEVNPTEVSKRIIKALRSPFKIDGQEVHVGGSVGIAIATSDIGDGDKLLRNADLAMYRAKTSGGDGFARYDPEMHVDLVERLQLEADLRRAIEGGELVIHYQPNVELDTGKVVGAEALVRWQHPTRGLVPPGQFVPLAEESGLIGPLGRYVLREACNEAVAWQRKHPKIPLTVSVNISPRQQHSEFVDVVAETLEESGLAPASLILEVTESVLMDHTEENLELFTRLKALGIRIAIDDFGTGYSSLSYLHRFPVDILKIDRSFIERLGDSDNDAELVSTIVQLGKTLSMRIIAEGIEDRAQLDALLKMGCAYGQGFYFSRPIVAESFTELVDDVLPRRRSVGRSKRVAA